MRACLINPNLDGSTVANLGLAYVLSAAEREHQIRLVDLSFHNKRYQQYLSSSLKGFKPEVVGFSVTTFTLHHALKIAALIRQDFPEIPLIYGGVHPTLLPEETLQNPLVDAICIGEGEDSFREYLDKLQDNQEPKGVAGIWYKDKTGAIVRNPLRPFKEDLDSLPFPNWDRLEIGRHLIPYGLRFLMSRGCPFSCSYCSAPAIRKCLPGKFYRSRSPENVMEEIKQNAAKHRFSYIYFADSTFGLDKEQLKKFTLLYIREGLHKKILWGCQTRPDLITQEWASMVAEAGCAFVQFGIESGDSFLRNEIFRRNISEEDILGAARNLKNNGIGFRVNLIMGSEEESTQSLGNTRRIIRAIKPYNVSYHAYQPLPRTELSISYGHEKTLLELLSKPEKIISWNSIRITPKNCSSAHIKTMTLLWGLKRAGMLFINGFKLKRLRFLKYLFEYIFNSGGKNMRKAPLLDFTCLIPELEDYLLYEKIIFTLEQRKKVASE